jgi:anti-sigma factor ChrR (cupin superfamily)
MNDIFQCGDSAALVAYLYDECAPGEQALIEAHLVVCAVCASEIHGLRATRRTLAAWTPPEQALGFRITREDEPRPAKILEPKIAWWRAPLPAWAQVAAALVIFGVGLSVGSARTTTSQDQTATVRTASVPPEGVQTEASSVSRDDLAQLEQKIRAELGQLRASNTATPAAARGSDDALIQRVRTMIDESAADERRNFTERMLNMADVIERQRRVDLAQIGNSMGQFRGATRDEIRQQNEAFSEALRRLVSDTPR